MTMRPQFSLLGMLLSILIINIISPQYSLAKSENDGTNGSSPIKVDEASVGLQAQEHYRTQPEQLFAEMDKDHDSSLSLSEFTSGFDFLSNSINDKKTKIIMPQLTGEFWNGFSSSTAMIIATEIGDKTFFIAAVLSMRNSRAVVFAGGISALILMTILSTMMGLILPSFLPKQYTHVIGGILFLYFGIKLIYDSRSMENKVSDELEEVEEELLHTNKKNETNKADDIQDDIESVSGSRAGIDSAPNSGTNILIRNETSSVTRAHKPSTPTELRNRIFFQSFMLTFLAEWGDRSQIATIALAAAKDPFGVTFGACFGHSLCTGMAVIGGRMLASRISERTVSFWGGFVFLAFAVHSLFFET